MRVVMLYRPNSEFARQAEEYMTDFHRFHPGEKIEILNIDSVEGSHTVQLYGVIEFPAVIAVSNDGVMQQMWQGIDRLPLMNDLAYYAQQ
jgi:hypothetical protein